MPPSHLNLNDIINALSPVLQEYQEEKAQLEDQITREGKVPSFLCDNCERKSIIEVKKLGVPKQQVASLLKWMRTNDVRELNSDGEIISFRSTKKFVEKVEGTMSLLSISEVLRPSTEEALYEYRLSASKLKKRECYDIVALPFEAIRVCSHLDPEAVKKSSAVLLTLYSRFVYKPGLPSVEQLWTKEPARTELRLLCPECSSRIEMIGCEDSIRIDGFV